MYQGITDTHPHHTIYAHLLYNGIKIASITIISMPDTIQHSLQLEICILNSLQTEQLSQKDHQTAKTTVRVGIENTYFKMNTSY